MATRASSLMVVLDQEEYCWLYDGSSFPDVLEELLRCRRAPDDAEPGFLHVDQARHISRGLLARAYQEI